MRRGSCPPCRSDAALGQLRDQPSASTLQWYADPLDPNTEMVCGDAPLVREVERRLALHGFENPGADLLDQAVPIPRSDFDAMLRAVRAALPERVDEVRREVEREHGTSGLPTWAEPQVESRVAHDGVAAVLGALNDVVEGAIRDGRSCLWFDV